MDFYNHRFDFIKVADENINPDELINNIISGQGTDEEKKKQLKELWKKIKEYCLVTPKIKYQISETEFVEIGDENIVDGSTCFFVNTGDLYIYKETYVYDNVIFNGFLDATKGVWYKVGGFDDENKGEYAVAGDEFLSSVINPYYQENEPDNPPVG